MKRAEDMAYAELLNKASVPAATIAYFQPPSLVACAARPLAPLQAQAHVLLVLA